MAGGFSEQQKATPYIQLLIDAHHSAIQRALNLSSSTTPLTALAWCEQVVGGTNYAISVQSEAVERLVEVEVHIFLAFFHFDAADAERLRSTDSVRSQLTRVRAVVGGSTTGSRVVGDVDNSWVEHRGPT